MAPRGCRRRGQNAVRAVAAVRNTDAMSMGTRTIGVGMVRARKALSLLMASAMALSPAAAGPALLFDAASGRVLYAEDQDDQWYPASLTKIMTAFLVFEALKDGKISLQDK